MQVGTRAVVLRTKSLEEFDRLVVLLTADQGVVTAYAKGARRQKGAMASATEQLAFSSFQLFRSRDRTFVDKAEAEALFSTSARIWTGWPWPPISASFARS